MTEEDVCRICRGEQTPDDPLYHPCRCAGSIKYVHRECLLEWLQHARTAHKCELCGTKYTMLQRYKSNMPESLYIRDYLKYVMAKALENAFFIFICVRGFVLVSCLAIQTKYLFEFSTIASSRVFYPRMPSTSWQILRDRQAQQPPRKSGAPLVDWLLSLVLPPSELRSAWVDGMLILLFFLVTFIILWVITMWVLNEPAVVHDLEHIGSGEISHMDNGDDDMVEFDDVNPVQENVVEGERNLAARRDYVAPNPPQHRPVQEPAPPPPEAAPRIEAQRFFFAANEEQLQLMNHLRQNGAIDFQQGDHPDINTVNQDPTGIGPEAAYLQDINGVPYPIVEVQSAASVRAEIEAAREPELAFNEPAGEIALNQDVPRANEVMPMRDEEEEVEEELEALGFAVRGLLFEIFGGTNAEAMGEFGVVSFVTLGLVEFVYMIPYIMIRIAWRVATALAARCALLLNKPQLAVLSTKLGLLELESLPGHFAVLFVHFALAAIALRYVELRYMPYLLKRDWGVSVVMALYQFYAVLKALLMMMIEFFAFPQFCGCMLHLVSIPLTPTFTDHWELCKRSPYLVLFSHWIIGFFYMHAIMTFVTTCRKFFRRGVLYFVHDGDAPDFIRAIVFVPVPKQLYRIGVSVILYGFFIVAGIGSVTLGLSKGLPLLNVTHWPGLEILRLWPLFVLFHACFVPLIPTKIQLYKVVNAWFREEVWLYILRFAAKLLDLDSWLFGRKRVLRDKEITALNNKDLSNGYFVRAPRTSRFRDRKNMTLFVPVNEKNERLDNFRGDTSNEFTKYVVVWRPPFFWLRIAVLAVLVWVAATVLLSLVTVVPLSLGRLMDKLVFDTTIANDILLYGTGMSVCVPIYAHAIRKFPPREMVRSPSFSGLQGRLPLPARRAWALIFIWSLLFTGMQIACPRGWSHWTIIWPLSSKTAVANFVVTYAAGLCAYAWLNSVAAADVMIFQQVLEVLGFVPPTRWVYWAAVEPVLLWRLWDRWSHSRQAQRWSATVRDFIYLDGTEIKNYTG